MALAFTQNCLVWIISGYFLHLLFIYAKLIRYNMVTETLKFKMSILKLQYYSSFPYPVPEFSDHNLNREDHASHREPHPILCKSRCKKSDRMQTHYGVLHCLLARGWTKQRKRPAAWALDLDKLDRHRERQALMEFYKKALCYGKTCVQG